MRLHAIWKTAGVAALALAFVATPVRVLAQSHGTVLKASEARKLLPASVYYKGQSATTQLRNSGGVKFSNGSYVLAVLVDNSGYSSDIAAKYQAYFITEVPLHFGAKSLPAGIYGIGFVGGHKFIVTDVGAHELLTTTYTTDEAIKRPLPLHVLADPAGGYRLYSGRNWVHFSR
ncbi:MAG TPA: hypothetical protein VND90_00035 [Terracidiphilus sp.]|nr:hypothetical protein [Terracidiphilus sp.]